MRKRKHKHKKHKIKVQSTFYKKTLFQAIFLCSIILFLWVSFRNNENQTIESVVNVVEETPKQLEEQKPEPQKIEKKELGYVEIIESCGSYFNIDSCVNIRSGPGTSYEAVAKMRNGVVLRTSGSVEAEGRVWYKIIFDEWLRYPERVETDWYVAGDFVRYFVDEGPIEIVSGDKIVTKKKIVVDLSEQTLYAYDGGGLFMKEFVSTGLELTKTPRGSFTLFKKMPTRYMQGPLPGISEQYYDLPGVPWTMYFTGQGAAIHGAYWHEKFGEEWSHGCVNLPPTQARELYEWADVGTPVIVQD